MVMEYVISTCIFKQRMSVLQKLACEGHKGFLIRFTVHRKVFYERCWLTRDRKQSWFPDLRRRLQGSLLEIWGPPPNENISLQKINCIFCKGGVLKRTTSLSYQLVIIPARSFLSHQALGALLRISTKKELNWLIILEVVQLQRVSNNFAVCYYEQG